MVYSFLVFSLDPLQCLVSLYYSQEGNDAQRKQRTSWLMSRLAAAIRYQASVAAQFEGAHDGTTISGIFQIKPNETVRTVKTAVWLRHSSLCFALLCEPNENRLLASDFLNLFVATLTEQLKVPAGGDLAKEILGKPEEVLAVVNHFLPGGVLLYANSYVTKSLKREVENTLSMKV